MSSVFSMDENINPDFALSWSCQSRGVSRTLTSSISCVFILAWFDVLQVIMEWPWWVGFSDRTQSWLFNGYSLWVVWIMILVEDWCEAFWGAKGCGEDKVIWSWWKGRKKHGFANGEKPNSCLLLTRMCGVCLEFHSNQLTLLEILSFATSHYATGMQLVVVCNYLGHVCNCKFGIV